MKIQIFFLLIFSSNCWAAKDYINHYFPQDSLVRKIHNSQPHGTGWFGFDNSLRSGCDCLNSIFEKAENRPYNDRSSWHHVYDSLKTLIKDILSNQEECVIQDEFDWAWQLNNYLENKAAQKYYNSPEYHEQLERENKLKAIQAAIILKDS